MISHSYESEKSRKVPTSPRNPHNRHKGAEVVRAFEGRGLEGRDSRKAPPHKGLRLGGIRAACAGKLEGAGRELEGVVRVYWMRRSRAGPGAGRCPSPAKARALALSSSETRR